MYAVTPPGPVPLGSTKRVDRAIRLSSCSHQILRTGRIAAFLPAYLKLESRVLIQERSTTFEMFDDAIAYLSFEGNRLRSLSLSQRNFDQGSYLSDRNVLTAQYTRFSFEQGRGRRERRKARIGVHRLVFVESVQKRNASPFAAAGKIPGRDPTGTVAKVQIQWTLSLNLHARKRPLKRRAPHQSSATLGPADESPKLWPQSTPRSPQ